MTPSPDALLDRVTQFFVSSSDFNGLPGRELGSNDLDPLPGLIRDGFVTAVFGDRHPNPHIIALPPEPIDEQLAKLESLGIADACLYPTRQHLELVVDEDGYRDTPFTYELALGEPQLDHRAFDLAVLEVYRNDPRYLYETDDISGSIAVGSDHFESDDMPQSDQVLLQSFGFAYDDDLSRAVAVFLRYLSDLSPEHQQVWRARELSGTYRLHPDYFRSSILGEWYERVSIFDAFLEEIRQVNAICGLIGRPPLFREQYEERPRGFGFLVRPTRREFNEFTNTLDKLMSQNLNHEFFRHEVPYEDLEVREDGVTTGRPRGTIRILEEWLSLKYRTSDPAPIEEAMATFKRVRKLRQRPAHAIEDDEFDQAFFREQRQLIIDAYEAVRVLRLVLVSHPRAKEHEVPGWLQDAEIWTY